MEIGLVGCGNTKEAFETEARKLYCSPLFRMTLELSEKWYERTYIVSAKHFIIPPNEVIGPYNLSLRDFDKETRRNWALHLWSELTKVATSGDIVYFFCGKLYYEELTNWASALWINSGISYVLPFDGMPIGKRMKFLKEQLNG